MKQPILVCLLLMVLLVVFSTQPASAKRFSLFGKPLNLFGFASQTVQISLKGDHYHVEEGLQQALLNVFLEGDYRPAPDLTLYASGLFTIDLIYDIKHDDKTWNEKLFSQSRDRLYLDDRSWQFIKEAHITWSPGDFFFRVGKQIVSWGEMDFFRIMDQINPLDQRRGFSDVEFETSIIPIWLVRTEYWMELSTNWLEELGLQFVFNPNAMFIPDQNPTTGNAVGGIWSGAYEIANPLYPYHIGTPTLYIGPLDERLIEPEQWDDEGFEYAVRLSAMIRGGILTLNGFYGRENTPKILLAGSVENPLLSQLFHQSVPALGTASDGTSIAFPIYEGFYPRQKFLGVTWTDNVPIRITPLGGVNPLLRLEMRYQFDKVFTDRNESMYIESDFVDMGIGIDWKVKINSLNPRAYFTVSPQFFYNRILDYPKGIELLDLPRKNYYTITCYLATSYFNGKLIPAFAGAYEFNNQAHLILPSITYIHTHNWTYSVEAAILGGEVENRSLWLFRKNDYIAFKVKYNWG